MAEPIAGWAAEKGVAAGVVVLSTCHRAELYLDVAAPDRAVGDLTAEILVRLACAGHPQGDELPFERHDGAAAADHLFAVASGLRSAVVGENEIAGQVRRALTVARAAGRTTPLLERSFQRAARASREVRSSTGIGGAGRSVVSAALDLAGIEQPEAALLIGTGSFARVVATDLRRRGVRTLFVHSPSGRAAAFAERHGAIAVDAGQLGAVLRRVDVVIGSSGTGVQSISADDVAAAVLERPRPLAVVDLALVPDVSPDIAAFEGVTRVGLDDVAAQTCPASREAVERALALVTAHRDEFMAGEAERAADPIVVALRRHIADLAERELSRLPADTAPEERELVAATLRRMTQSLLHQPTVQARHHARQDAAGDYVRALRTVFGDSVQHSVPS